MPSAMPLHLIGFEATSAVHHSILVAGVAGRYRPDNVLSETKMCPYIAQVVADEEDEDGEYVEYVSSSSEAESTSDEYFVEPSCAEGRITRVPFSENIDASTLQLLLQVRIFMLPCTRESVADELFLRSAASMYILEKTISGLASSVGSARANFASVLSRIVKAHLFAAGLGTLGVVVDIISNVCTEIVATEPLRAHTGGWTRRLVCFPLFQSSREMSGTVVFRILLVGRSFEFYELVSTTLL